MAQFRLPFQVGKGRQKAGNPDARKAGTARWPGKGARQAFWRIGGRIFA
jgi:hypothetical protein